MSDLNKKLLKAAKNHNLPLITSLVEQGADIDTKDEDNRSPLWFACINVDNSDLPVIKYLVENGADINTQNNYFEETPLHVVCKFDNDNIEIVKYLVEHGANKEIEARGETPLDIVLELRELAAEDNNEPERFDELIEYLRTEHDYPIQENRHEIELQRRRMENLRNPGTYEIEEQEIESGEVSRPSEHTPHPLQIIQDQALLNKPLTSYVWPGKCQICLEPETSDLCRVNCDIGHIFHCDCINGFRDTYTIYGWNNKCPICRTPIDKMVKVTSNVAQNLPTSFGKAKRRSKNLTLKQINKLIKSISK